MRGWISGQKVESVQYCPRYLEYLDAASGSACRAEAENDVRVTHGFGLECYPVSVRAICALLVEFHVTSRVYKASVLVFVSLRV